MAIKIQTKKTTIPIELGDLKYEFDVSDENIVKFREAGMKIQEEIESIDFSGGDSLESIEKAKVYIRKGYDIMLGEGSFDEVYEKYSPSIVIMADYLQQISIGLNKELDKMGYKQQSHKVAKKYKSKKK